MPTPKSKRLPPTRRLDDYVVNRVNSEEMGLTDVPEEKFTLLNGSEFTPGSPTTYWQTLSSPITLGFDLTLDGKTYRSFQISTCGWLILLDSTAPTAVTLTDLGLTDGYDVELFSVTSFSGADHLVLLPWASRLRGLRSSYTSINALATRLKHGFEAPPKHLGYNERTYGIQYVCKQESKRGRRTVVRWNTLTDPDTTRDIRLARFDCVIYESGRLEFRYDKRSSALPIFDDVVAGAENYATVAAIRLGTYLQPQFRDLSIELNYATTRERHPLGGTRYNASYTDAGSYYGRFLTYASNWVGGAFVLSPPMNRKKILRSDVNIIDNVLSYPRTNVTKVVSVNRTFNDQNVPMFVTQSIDLTVGIPRFLGAPGKDALVRRDLFPSLGNITASLPLSRCASDQFLYSHEGSEARQADAFNDEIAQTTGSFAVSGSDQDLYTGVISGDLRNKTRIDVSFPVDYRTQLLSLTSSIHYYDPNNRLWRMPPRSTTTSTSTASLGANSDLEDFSPSRNLGTNYDYRGWTALGNFASSASLGTRENLAGFSLTTQNLTTLIATGSVDSVTQNPLYDAGDCSFSLPIGGPFLLEKIVIKLPIEAGPGWFSDITTTGRWQTTGQHFAAVVDTGGPALTFVLMNEQRNNDVSRRDIILSGTITHVFDNTRAVRATPIGTPSLISFNPAGFLHNGQPSAVITVNSTGSFFTGSVQMNLEAMTSIGADLSVVGISDALTSIQQLISSSETPGIQFFIPRTNPIGRAKTGFDVGNASVYGKEHLGLNINNLGRNPFYMGTTDVSVIEENIALSGSGMSYIASYMTTRASNKQSPYLIHPSDRLVMAIAKSRPWIPSGSNHTFSPHDVKLDIGKIEVSFFGTHVRSEIEKQLFFDQSLHTTAIHSVIGNEPITDQFEGTFRRLYRGTSRDDYITGSLVSIGKNANGDVVMMTGSRSRVFSIVDASQTPLNLTSSLNVIDPNVVGESILTASANANTMTLAYNARPYFHRAPSVRLNVAISETERFYDSMPPSFTDCTRLNGGSIIKGSGSLLENVNLMMLIGSGSYVDNVWLRSFPFEPRYASVGRIKELNRSFVAKNQISGSLLVPIDPHTTNGLLVNNGMYYADSRSIYSGSGASYRLMGMNSSDTAKVLFGFGDRWFMGTSGSTIYGVPTGVDGAYNVTSLRIGPIPRGWQYGLISALPLYTKSYWRTNCYGQPRDMLEQRPDTRFYDTLRDQPLSAPVIIRFVDSNGRLTKPESTWAQNMSFEATSSIPYIDNVVRNRDDVNVNVVNQNILNIRTDQFGNTSL